MGKIHLLCNAHLDPVWQWEWEEGAAAAVSTFRAAADFCEEYEQFIFNHNEVILYKWIEEYEPELFVRIQRLVREGKWHIIGGWYLQPDCNIPSGESFVRQILMGRQYFKEKFGVVPTTAINFDSFGHTRGLVQILAKSGYNSYICTRPDQISFNEIPQDFIWVGYEGSEIKVHRIWGGYNSQMGKSVEKIEKWMSENPDKPLSLISWGVGNHGGGPSRVDLDMIGTLMKKVEAEGKFEIIHSTPEAYFEELLQRKNDLPTYNKDLNPRFVGCYTSQVRIKQKHRQLENELYMVEKMLSHASLRGVLEYPQNDLNEAFCDLMTAQFHDILPGSSVQPVEESSIRMLDHGLEIASRLKARAFFALSQGEEKAKEGEYPILIYNPHPYKVKGIFEAEFMLQDQNWKEEFSMPIIYKDGVEIPSQCEKELSNLNLDWRKRVTFRAELEPSQMNRFDCKIKILPEKPKPEMKSENNYYVFKNESIEACINCETGLMDSYKVFGKEYVKQGSFLPVVFDDNEDPWRMDVNTFDKILGKFTLMNEVKGTEFSGVTKNTLASVRVVEQGKVRTVVESILEYNHSNVVITYKFPQEGTEIEIQVRVFWNEKNKMLKLIIPTNINADNYIGQVSYGRERFLIDGTEVVAQKWVAAVSEEYQKAITLINDGIYGSNFKDGSIQMTLLRSPAYCAHPIYDRPIIPQDRFLPRIDQGERVYTFWLNAGDMKNRLDIIDNEALCHNEKPYALSFFPSGNGEKADSIISMDEPSIQLAAFMKHRYEEGKYVLRFFETTGEARRAVISIPGFSMNPTIQLGGFEIKTYILDATSKTFEESDIIQL